jgi:flagellar hook-basal body complex protein FliE
LPGDADLWSMKKTWISLAVIALLALPAAAVAKHHKQPSTLRNAAKYCKSLRAQLGTDSFRQAYGGQPNAFGKCVKQRVQKVNATRKAALRDCKQQLKGQSNQLRRHGDGPGKHGALRKCVRDKTQADNGNDDEGTVAAVKQCTDEQAADPAGFDDQYATDDPGRTTFEECVSEHADDNETTTDPGDGTDDSTQPGDESPGGDSTPGDSSQP